MSPALLARQRPLSYAVRDPPAISKRAGSHLHEDSYRIVNDGLRSKDLSDVSTNI